MEFSIEILDYGRYGVVAREPRTRLEAWGSDRDEARKEIVRRLRDYDGYLPPDEGPIRAIETVKI